jgi:two-component system probable response regulator PhcQ
MNTESRYDYKKFAILYVDDEEQSLSLFKQAFEDEFHVYTAASAQAGLKLLEKHADEIGILMTDQRMPGEKGVWLLERARQVRPRILRILVTAYTDMDAAIQAVNTGSIYKYVTKPWDPVQLEITLKRGMEFFMVQAERDQLLREKRSLMRERMLASRMVSLGLVSAGLNHHIGNRLQTVKIFLDLTKSGSLDNALLNKSQMDVEEILGLLADLQVASADHNGKSLQEEVRLRPALAGLLAELHPAFESRKMTVENLVPENLPVLKTDSHKFKRLLDLLFKYEIAMLPAGSKIQVSAGENAVNEKPGIAFTITDDGPPLPPDALRLVIDPLVIRGHPSEYSINLMVCFFIVHRHGGTIEAGPGASGGNQFIIRLPLQPEAAALSSDESQFLQRVLLNEQLWDKMMAQNY